VARIVGKLRFRAPKVSSWLDKSLYLLLRQQVQPVGKVEEGGACVKREKETTTERTSRRRRIRRI
jgi:hypothetical protein